ncbi:MAG: prepilin-type N-terminal cleavage/methylation domain-containing protein, partial [Clostridia bacterium]|nr:prepilin-type N-terminal cleavage/methylation domain-containing protein [Clostridia bacterium]
MKRLLKDRRGMTLMEIVVALALLLLVIVGTTPVMLSAFDGVYKAGEKTQEVYDAKTEIEQNLATRNSAINYKGFIVNFNGLGQSIKVNGNRAVSSLYNSLETLFTGAKARVYIASGSVVNDDASSHDIILQTSNIDFESIDEIGVNGEKTLSPRDDKTAVIETLVDINAYIPQKELTSTLAADIYKSQKATVTLNTTTTNVETGRIGITIAGTAANPIDFTTSPIKIVLEYLDENDKPQKVHTYLTIKTPTIMFAGETSNDITYYTSAGVVKEINKDGTYTTSFTAEERKMNIGKFNDGGQHITGAQSTIAVPTGTVFKSINWITEYEKTTGGTGNENVDFASTPYDPQYYVLTGTNGAIYRTYSFNQPAGLSGKVNLYTNPGINGYALNSKTGQNQSGVDVMGVKDTYVVLDDRASTIVYPATWGGDFSHIFGWSSYEDEMGYISRRSVNNPQPSSADTWQTEDDNNPGTGLPGFYSNLASLGYYYNGWGSTASYPTLNSRKISYILTEVPNSIRIGGLLNGVGSTDDDEYGYDGSGFDRIWERPLTVDLKNSWQTSYYNWKEDESYWYTAKN